MIPKIIHYCWLSNDPFPEKIQMCMQSWKEIMPDYEWKLWNTQNFDIEKSVPYVKEAFAHRKWAFVADYIRLYALYEEGGIYLDSDVKVLKRFDDFLHHSFFSCVEYHPFMIERDNSLNDIGENGLRITDKYISGIELQAAVMGAEKGCPFVKHALDWYQDKHFIKPDGSMGLDVIAPQIYARIAENYGFRYKDIDQKLKDRMMIYRSEIFAGNRREVTPASYAIHYCENSWIKLPLPVKIKHYWKFFLFLVKSKIRSEKV
ncbi:glycosyltransferase family 32 protein [uncultured Bacteroides sp.]|uniref:glycosyltransferase family 32 protein n=1 Tax=uncultured Bacteroides sp. TaxID=162156 RepID=UPI0026763DE7|nr:glycosyltransferase [uncultured Bacteroides sp.]